MAAPPAWKQLGSFLRQVWHTGIADTHIRDMAQMVRKATRDCRQIPLLTTSNPGFDTVSAYKVSAALAGSRVSTDNGQQYPVGRKIGFTNQNIWSEYNVNEPIWGYLWKTGTHHGVRHKTGLQRKSLNLQPRIEPEIIFGLKKTPHSSMTEKEALQCVQWVAQGFEVVQSLFKDWKFSAADTIAMNALHRSLHIGEKMNVGDRNIAALLSQLESFTVDLCCFDKLVETGAGRNVLGSPVKALLHLCKTLENQNLHPQLLPGEIIATGTLTNALPITIKDKWSTQLRGIDLQGLNFKVYEMPVKISRISGQEHQTHKGTTSGSAASTDKS